MQDGAHEPGATPSCRTLEFIPPGDLVQQSSPKRCKMGEKRFSIRPDNFREELRGVLKKSCLPGKDLWRFREAFDAKKASSESAFRVE
jgi:hypothetical protein